MNRIDIPQAGVINTRNWLHTADGDQFNAFWCRRWLLVTDKEADLAGIKTNDKWAAVAYDADGNIVAIIPGCEVSGYITSWARPNCDSVWCFGR